jgi:hypothetical protein
VLLGQLAPRDVERDAALLGVLLEVVLALGEARRLPRPHRAFAQRLRFVRNHRPKSTPITRPKPRHVLHAPSGELNENAAGVGSE